MLSLLPQHRYVTITLIMVCNSEHTPEENPLTLAQMLSWPMTMGSQTVAEGSRKWGKVGVLLTFLLTEALPCDTAQPDDLQVSGWGVQRSRQEGGWDKGLG